MDSEISISLRDFDRSIDEAYKALFPEDPDKSAELLEWRFRLNPHGATRFAVASDADRVVGMIALIPTRLRNAPGKGLGYQAVDTAVHPSCRGQGLFVKMGSLAQDPVALSGEILWGFPNASAAPGWYGRLGWTDFGAVPLLMRPLRSSFLLGRVHPRLRSIDLPLIRGRKLSSEIYVDGAQLSADFDRLWQRVAPRFGITVDRSGEWMRWRLVDKPGAQYRCVGLKSDAGDLDAFVAVKVADKHGGRLCYVMEAIGAPDRTADLARLLRGELALAARSGAEVALAWCPKSAPSYPAYRRAGFLPVPSRLRPIEINFGARAVREECAAGAAPGADWYGLRRAPGRLAARTASRLGRGAARRAPPAPRRLLPPAGNPPRLGPAPWRTVQSAVQALERPHVPELARSAGPPCGDCGRPRCGARRLNGPPETIVGLPQVAKIHYQSGGMKLLYGLMVSKYVRGQAPAVPEE